MGAIITSIIYAQQRTTGCFENEIPHSAHTQS